MAGKSDRYRKVDPVKYGATWERVYGRLKREPTKDKCEKDPGQDDQTPQGDGVSECDDT